MKFLFLVMQIVGFMVGVVPLIRKLMIGSDAPLHVIQDSVTMLGSVCMPKLLVTNL